MGITILLSLVILLSLGGIIIWTLKIKKIAPKKYNSLNDENLHKALSFVVWRIIAIILAIICAIAIGLLRMNYN